MCVLWWLASKEKSVVMLPNALTETLYNTKLRLLFLFRCMILLAGLCNTRNFHCAKKATIHQVTTMLATSKNILFSGHNHLLTTGTDDPTLWLSPKDQYRWLAGRYDLEIGHFYKWLAWWLPVGLWLFCVVFWRAAKHRLLQVFAHVSRVSVTHLKMSLSEPRKFHEQHLWRHVYSRHYKCGFSWVTWHV